MKTLCIVAGGPSAADTIAQQTGDIVAVNGSHDWLISQGIIPWACGLMDWRERLADMVTPRQGVRYFAATSVHPAMVAKLRGFDVVRWDNDKITGGCTMGLRWLNLGYSLGYRSFELHGFDSSFRDDRTHAYSDPGDGKLKGRVKIDGFLTSLKWVAQITDFFRTRDRFMQPDMGPVSFTIHGDGLFQRRVTENNRVFSPEVHAELNTRRRIPEASIDYSGGIAPSQKGKSYG